MRCECREVRCVVLRSERGRVARKDKLVCSKQNQTHVTAT